MPIYMKYEGIKGTAKGKYNGWIELISCQLGGPRTMSSPSGANRKPSENYNPEITIAKFEDEASILLLQDIARGNYSQKVTIDFVKDGESVPYMSFELENALITSYTTGGNSSDDTNKRIESFSMTYSKISYSVKAIKLSHEPIHVKEKAQWNMAIK